ncbi:hypothetical protein QOT17_005928 [Balamuthia mandrillaris]
MAETTTATSPSPAQPLEQLGCKREGKKMCPRNQHNNNGKTNEKQKEKEPPKEKTRRKIREAEDVLYGSSSRSGIQTLVNGPTRRRTKTMEREGKKVVDGRSATLKPQVSKKKKKKKEAEKEEALHPSTESPRNSDKTEEATVDEEDKKENNSSFDPFDLNSVDSFALRQYVRSCDVESWYDALKEYTFDTKFVALSKAEANAILHFQESHIFKKEVVTKEDTKILQTLRERIDKVLLYFNNDNNKEEEDDEESQKSTKQNDKLKSKERNNREGETETMAEKLCSDEEHSGAFIRLSSRSPKDSVLSSFALKEALSQVLENTKQVDENKDAIAWYIAVNQALKIHSAQQGLDTFLLKSYRIYQDVTQWLKHSEEGPLNIVLRKWMFIHPSMEFRGFVYKRRITGLSQYIDSCFFRTLVEKQDWCKHKILEFFDDVKDILPVETCVIDFAILPEDERVVIIELNPFYPKTGTALFSWELDLDILRSETVHNEEEEEESSSASSSSSSFPELRIIKAPQERRSKGFFTLRQEVKEFNEEQRRKKGAHKKQEKRKENAKPNVGPPCLVC